MLSCRTMHTSSKVSLATLEHLIVQKDRVTLGEFIYDLLRNATDLYQRALNEESGQDLLLLNTFTRITAGL